MPQPPGPELSPGPGQAWLHAGLKGYPPGAAPRRVAEVASAGWHLLDPGMAFPVAVLRAPALAHNLRWMQDYVARKGLSLAPHGKTTMSPELFSRQLAAGAWGLTFANVLQARTGLLAGARRLVIANQLLSDADLDALREALADHANARIWFLVDSLAQLRHIEDWQRRRAAPAFDALLELGVAGYRSGCRDATEALALARAMHASPALRLGGVECYEGGLIRCDSAHDSSAIADLVQRAQAVVRAIDDEALWDDAEILLSAGGSAVFDLVVPLLRTAGLRAPVRGVLRSGCYLTHDHGNYRQYLQLLEQREGLQGSLQPALEVWALVQSVPEPGLALLSAGRRDLSHDQRLPVPVRWAAALHRESAEPRTKQRSAGQTATAAALLDAPAHWRIEALSDQHAHLRFDPDGTAPALGDRIALGISHPCTTFDRWPWLALIDDAGRIVDAVSTRF